MEIELNVADLLRAQNVPLTWTARVHNVRVDVDMLILGMGQ
jgi:hypothetical protein